MDHKARVESLMDDAWRMADGSLADGPLIIAHAMLHLAEKIEHLTIITAASIPDDEEEYEDE